MMFYHSYLSFIQMLNKKQHNNERWCFKMIITKIIIGMVNKTSSIYDHSSILFELI